jgi:hypothetical protein
MVATGVEAALTQRSPGGSQAQRTCRPDATTWQTGTWPDRELWVPACRVKIHYLPRRPNQLVI